MQRRDFDSSTLCCIGSYSFVAGLSHHSFFFLALKESSATQALGCNTNVTNQPPPPPPLPPTQLRWKKHTMGGKCIYCGDAGISPDHLGVCPKYHGDDNTEESRDGGDETLVLAGSKRPFAGDSTPASSKDNTDNAAAVASNKPPPPPVLANPAPAKVSTAKKPRPAATAAAAATDRNQEEEFIFDCLACGRKGCPYENGYTVLDAGDGQENEFDPCEPIRKDWRQTCQNKETQKKEFSFDEVKGPIRVVVAAALRSKNFWAVTKYIGSPSLDFNLRTWMKRILHHILVDNNWILLRRGVKMALRYKRQGSVLLIKKAYFGECYFVTVANQRRLLTSFCLASFSSGIESHHWLLSSTPSPVWYQ